MELTIVKKQKLRGKASIVGPIPEGQTPVQAANAAVKYLQPSVEPNAIAFSIHKKPLYGKNQQFPCIIGTFWLGRV